jgi:hypothetical protein
MTPWRFSWCWACAARPTSTDRLGRRCCHTTRSPTSVAPIRCNWSGWTSGIEKSFRPFSRRTLRWSAHSHHATTGYDRVVTQEMVKGAFCRPAATALSLMPRLLHSFGHCGYDTKRSCDLSLPLSSFLWWNSKMNEGDHCFGAVFNLLLFCFPLIFIQRFDRASCPITGKFHPTTESTYWITDPTTNWS